MRRKWPNTNLGWHEYYVARYCKNGSPYTLYLADLHWLFHLAFGNERIPS